MSTFLLSSLDVFKAAFSSGYLLLELIYFLPSSIKSLYFSEDISFARNKDFVLSLASILFSSEPADLSASNAVPIAIAYIAAEVPPVVKAPATEPPIFDPALIILFHQEEFDPPAIPDHPN